MPERGAHLTTLTLTAILLECAAVDKGDGVAPSRHIAGRGSAWLGAWFGTKRSLVQIQSPRLLSP